MTERRRFYIEVSVSDEDPMPVIDSARALADAVYKAGENLAEVLGKLGSVFDVTSVREITEANEETSYVRDLNNVYRERNAMVVAFADLARRRGWSVGRIEDDEALDWPILAVETPEGQVSWHLPKAEFPNWTGLVATRWDGHTTEEKYERLRRIQRLDDD